MTPADLIAEARTWEGVQFRHQGRSKESGVDCIGYFVCMLAAHGRLPDDFRDNPCYGRAPNTTEFIDTVERICTPIDVVEDGCLATIAWPQAKYPSHAAIIDGEYMIHAYERAKKVVRCGYGEPWLRMTRGRAHPLGIYRLPGVEPAPLQGST